MSFPHGINIQEVAPAATMQEPETCVIFLLGAAPIHLGTAQANVLTYVGSEAAAATFGPDLTGYTIPNALAAIQAYGTSKVVVLNVFDPAIHKTSVPAETIVLGTDSTATLAHTGVVTATVKNQGGTTNYVAGTDYTLDKATAKITRLASGAIAAGATLSVAYDYGDPSKVMASDIIGTVNEAGLRTGLQACIDIPSTFGFKPRILLVPGYNTQGTVIAALEVMASKIKAHAYLDAPIGTTITQALESRGLVGTLNWNTSDRRMVLCYPHVQVAGDSGQLTEPYSQNLAGLASSVDASEGYWVSFSNHEMKRINALERPIEWRSGDDACEANQLNAQGIVTAVRRYGTGFLAWGNRSAAWPASTDPLTFICVAVVTDLLEEAVERAALPWVDKPLNKADLDSIREEVNAYLDRLKQKGALLGGSCTWTSDDNPVDEMALGHAKFRLSFMPPVPMEQITFTSQVDTTWLKTLYQAQSA